VSSSSPAHEIPIALLSRQDPILDQILFYEDVPLFEDELHDNGESILNARIVSYPTSARDSILVMRRSQR
jgi:type 2A phosphatase activator TIP41